MAGSASEGAMMAAGRYSQVFDTAGNAVGGVLQADIEMWSAEMNRSRQMMTITRGKDRMFWIGERKRFNRYIIDRTAAGQYKAIPTVSVSALRKTILAAQAKGGMLVDDFMTLVAGDEVWFVRSDYSSFGTMGIRNGVRVFKSPTGVVLNVDATTDIMFLSKSQWGPSGTLERIENWARNSKIKHTIYHETKSSYAPIIKAEGFRIESEGVSFGHAYGHGAYFSKQPAKYFGNTVVKVKINVKKPLYDRTKSINTLATGKDALWKKIDKWAIKNYQKITGEVYTPPYGYTFGATRITSWENVITAYCKANKYDALVTWEMGQEIYVVFDKRNIMVIGGE